MTPKPLLQIKCTPTRPGKGKMTVCTSALAAEEKAIVCMADKALSYGEMIQWDSDSSKMFALRNDGLVIMFAGNEEPTSRILAKVIAREAELGNDIAATKRILEAEYQEAVQEIIEAKYLTPRLMTRAEYIQAISGNKINSFIESIAREVKCYMPDASLIVSGFDERGKPFILTVDAPGVVIDMTITAFIPSALDGINLYLNCYSPTSHVKTRYIR